MSSAREHAKYSASNAHRFMACPGQVALAMRLPDIETEWSREGTFAHKALEACIEVGTSVAKDLVGEPILDNRPVDLETAKAVQHVLDYIQRLRKQYPNIQVFSERPFRLKELAHLGFADIGGTVDVLAIDWPSRSVWAIDYKHGAGTEVRVERNPQLMMALAAHFGFETFTGTIIQPNHWAYTCAREQNFSAAELIEFLVDLEAAVEAAERTDAPLVPGTHCHHCKAAASCPALEMLGAKAIIATDTQQTAFVLAHAEPVRIWLKAREEAALREALSGKQIPGYKLARGGERRRWRPDLTEEMLAGQIRRISNGRLTDDDIMPRELLSLTKIEALLVDTFRNAVPPEQRDQAAQEARKAFAFLTLKDAGGGLSLVPETDKRPAAQGTAHLDFANVKIV